MIERQTEMPLYAGKPVAKNITWLEDLLRDRRDWMTAIEILQAVCMKDSDDNKRYIRQLANASDNVLSGPGSPGYKHVACCTMEEVDHYTNAGMSQGKQMVKRAIRIRRAAHKILG
jgi:hypothetical protein